ncbi:sodium-dependent transporter [Candidatus Peregrinibacteria bacterium]|jgi:neurotransmitter:Na+ symporter, NSS family|nr:sodium-dependent transporter [Candidatus Peregrinibacteria bacterium]MBT5468222.1 sodium-dependent transporter [Candidatus Peregrinibacteria bacterium]MBT7337823.1 sodium-dependent transporter [Candidatus Peregrinibacteria bacterium]
MTTHSSLWQSKWFFILASVGAAAGLGNLWRFPYMVYENGGAVFIIAYLVCLFLLVIPLMMVEVAIGQTERQEFINLLSDKGGWIGRFVGWMMILLIIVLLGYYTPVAAWGLDYLFHSLSVSWSSGAEEFFYSNILQITDKPSIFGGFSSPVVWGLAISYLAVFFSIFQGIKSISRVIKWTVSLPFVLLAVLFINSLFLPGSTDGFLYLLVPDWPQILSIGVWKSAASQAFLSANIGLIITIFYARFNAEHNDIVRSTLFIALGNAAVSFLAAFAIFGTLGHTALAQGKAITDVVVSGPTLAFVAFPDALAALPFGKSIFSILFFITIFTLAVDTIFAALEVVVATLNTQIKCLQKIPYQLLTALCCGLFFLWSLAFAGGNGLYRLDAMDHALWAHVFYWAVIPQIIIFGWKMPVSALRERINASSSIHIGYWFDIIIKWAGPLFLITVYLSSLPGEFAAPYEGYDAEFLKYWMYGPMIGIATLSALLALRKPTRV